MISIVVCTHNGVDRIRPCLESIAKQKNPPLFELIVVDNDSTDKTSELVSEQLESNFSEGLWKIINESTPGLLYARMAGLREAQFEWVLFCDDDNILFPDFLFQSEQVLSKNHRIGVLGSHGIPEFLGPRPEWFDRYSSSYAVGPQHVGNLEGKRLFHVYGACSIYRKKPIIDLFEKGFQPVLTGRKGKEMSAGDDVEWCWLMQLMGYQIAYSAKLQFIHQLPASRLTWDYYLHLKRGISGSVGLLSTYTFFTSYSIRPFWSFMIFYSAKTLKATLLYLKYGILWGKTPRKPEDQLSFTILDAQMQAYFKQGKASFAHYRQLLRYFGS